MNGDTMRNMLAARIAAAEARMNKAAEVYAEAAERATDACDTLLETSREYWRLRRLADPDLDTTLQNTPDVP